MFTRSSPPQRSGDPSDFDLTPPASVTAARAHPHYEGKHGWKAAMAKEVSRVIGFKAIRLSNIRNFHSDVHVHVKVSI
jgi:hypothetical protein